jgi:membrane protein DedA with SNARE-associated domain
MNVVNILITTGAVAWTGIVAYSGYKIGRWVEKSKRS